MPATITLVVDVEAETPRPLGSYWTTREDVVCYLDLDGNVRQAPEDCVVVVKVALPELLGARQTLDDVRRETKPVPGLDGWRFYPDGRRFYSTCWLGLTS